MHDTHKVSHKHSKVIEEMSYIWGPGLSGNLALHELPRFMSSVPV